MKKQRSRSIMIDGDNYQKLVELAKTEDRTLEKQINRVLRFALEAKKSLLEEKESSYLKYGELLPEAIQINRILENLDPVKNE